MQSKQHGSFVVRPMVAEDEPAVRDIYDAATADLRQVYAPRCGIFGDKEEVSQRLVVTEMGVVLGVVEYIDQPDQVYVRALAVARRHRRQGVAKCLMSGVEELAKNAHKQAIVLRTVSETGNVEIFSRLGFSEVNREQTNRFVATNGSDVHVVEMRRCIGGKS
ncbi:N-acetyltransferase family protein [Methylocaldum gracile]